MKENLPETYTPSRSIVTFIINLIRIKFRKSGYYRMTSSNILSLFPLPEIMNRYQNIESILELTPSNFSLFNSYNVYIQKMPEKSNIYKWDNENKLWRKIHDTNMSKV